jgi:hypothetical protein
MRPLRRPAVLAAALAIAAMAALPRPVPDRSVRLLAVHGALALLNSRSGAAILEVPQIAPGESHTGTVTIANGGRGAGHLYLDTGDPLDRPGPNGGSLVERLDVTIAREGGGPVTRGTLASIAGCHDLGIARGGERRTYRLTVRMPARGDDNRYEGSSASVDLRWRETPGGAGCRRWSRGMAGERAVRAPAQARERGDNRGDTGDAGGTLPFTGLTALVLAGAGAALVALGSATRRLGRRRGERTRCPDPRAPR